MNTVHTFLLALALSVTSLPGIHAQEMTADAQAPETAMQDSTMNQLIAQHPQLTTLAAALQSAELTAPLDSSGNFFLLAPTDEAFAALPAGVMGALLQPANHDALIQLLQYHLIDNSLDDSAATMSRVIDDGEVAIGEQLTAGNGVIYLIDQVLIPEDLNLEALSGGK